MGRKYNSLLFDLDDTLLEYSSQELNFALNILKNHALPCTPDVAEVFLEINDWHTFELGRIITVFDVVTNRFSILLKILEVEENIAYHLKKEFFEMMSASHKLKKGALKTLRYLKEQNYKLYITTNGYPEFQYRRIKSSRIQNFFDGIFISEEIGYQKPSPMFFNYVAGHIPESSRSRMLIIGDAPTADILGGINARIDTCFINNDGKVCRYKYTYKIERIDQLINLL